MPHILALDEGTSSARAIVFDHQINEISRGQVPIRSTFPNAGWVEQDAEQIWEAQLLAIHRAIQKANISLSEISVVGITNQRETVIVWDRKTGKAICPAIVWQCRRTSEMCRALLEAGHGPNIKKRTGLVVDPYFSGTKIAWILNNISGARKRAEAGDLLFGTVDSWLVYRLTNGRSHLTDSSNASRTLLFNIQNGSWDEDLFQMLNIPSAMRPSVAPSSGAIAVTDASILGKEILIGGIAGDQQSALFGQACFRSGLLKNTYGTGSFVMLHTGTKAVASRNNLLTTLAASETVQNRYALEGSIFVAGGAVQWLRDSLGILESTPQSEEIAYSVSDSAGVYLVPAFVGLGAPHWDPKARGIISGLTHSTNRAHVVRAALESIAYQTRELVTAMESDTGITVEELRVDGGATANNFLLQFQADILGKPVLRPRNIETTALGAAFLAGLAVGIWQDTKELEELWKVDRRFDPQMSTEQAKNLFEGWQCAVEKAKQN